MKSPVVNGPQDLPKLRLYLLHLWRKDGPLEQSMNNVESSAFTLPGQKEWAPGRTWAEWERQQLANAELWWVRSVMSKSIPLDTRLGDIAIPSNSGLVVFEKPWLGYDSRNTENLVAVSAVVWGRTSLGALPGREQEPPVEAFSFSAYEYLPEWLNLNRETDGEEAALRLDQVRRFLDSGGHMASMSFRNQTFDSPEAIQRVVEGMAKLTEEELEGMSQVQVAGGSNWLPLGRSDWPLVDKLVDPISDIPKLAAANAMSKGTIPPSGLDNIDASFQEDRRMMSAFWTLVQTPKIATTPTLRAPRPERRRYERAGHAPNLSDVRVVQLRKIVRPEAPGSDEKGHKKVEWSCQWPVTAHPRLQPYGPGKSLRKLIVVGPFLKGPTDKPLRVRQEVKAFIR